MKIIQNRKRTGYPSRAMGGLRRSINGYLSNWPHLYIGATANPSGRASIHQRNGWEWMILLYQTTSVDYARQVERSLIAFARSTNHWTVPSNQANGGEGLVRGAAKYYVYVLLA